MKHKRYGHIVKQIVEPNRKNKIMALKSKGKYSSKPNYEQNENHAIQNNE